MFQENLFQEKFKFGETLRKFCRHSRTFEKILEEFSAILGKYCVNKCVQ